MHRAAGRASSAIKESFAGGARSSFAATGGSSTKGTVGSESSGASSPNAGSDGASPPAWARRMKHNQALIHGGQTAAHILRSGDSHGGGHSVDLSGGE